MRLPRDFHWFYLGSLEKRWNPSFCLLTLHVDKCVQSLTQWYQLEHRPLPSSRSARVPMRAYIAQQDWSLETGCWSGDYVIRGGRILSVSQRRDLQKQNSTEVLSVQGEVRIFCSGSSLLLGEIQHQHCDAEVCKSILQYIFRVFRSTNTRVPFRGSEY